MAQIELSISELITILQELQAKGHHNVQLLGTLLCQEDGNTVITSTSNQF